MSVKSPKGWLSPKNYATFAKEKNAKIEEVLHEKLLSIDGGTKNAL